MPEFICLKQLLEYRARSRSSHYRDVHKGLFTKAIKLGPRSVVWPVLELEILTAARVAGCPEKEIKQLVETLHLQRKQAYAEFSGDLL